MVLKYAKINRLSICVVVIDQDFTRGPKSLQVDGKGKGGKCQTVDLLSRES